jgi:hypothetical protein
MAMQGLCMRTGSPPENVADMAIRFADALLAALGEKKG